MDDQLSAMQRQLAATTENLKVVGGQLVEAKNQNNEHVKAKGALALQLANAGVETKELQRSAKQAKEETESLEMYRMILSGLLVLALGLAVVGFVRKPKPA